MTLLDLSSKKPKKVNKFRQTIISLFAVCAVITGVTLAANINLNVGENVEFGQGVVQAAACDDEIVVTPQSTFDNTDGSNTFKFSSILLTGIDSTSDNCDGKDFVIKAYDELDNLLNIFSFGSDEFNSLRVWDVGGTFIPISDGSQASEMSSNENNSDDLTDTSFQVNFDNPIAAAEDVYRITVESVNHEGGDGLLTFNGHIYQIIDVPSTWNDAYIDITTPVAGECKYQMFGMCGYFANITSEEEKEFIINNLGLNQTWLGGSDSANEGTWNWIDGPEFGDTFFVGKWGSGTYNLITYANWADGEPNDAGNEDALQTYSWSGGPWNDLNAGSGGLPYVIEYSPNFTERTNWLP
jgi:Lectin C-type domain